MTRGSTDSTAVATQGEAASPTTRRRLVALGAAAAATVAGTFRLGVASNAHAASGQPLIMGAVNEADPGSQTQFNTNVVNPAGGPIASLAVTNQAGSAISGVSLGSNMGNNLSEGVFARGGPRTFAGVHAICDSTDGYGVFGRTTNGGIGVGSTTDGDGIGVDGFSTGGTAVHAHVGSSSATALHVEGKARFSTAGSSVISVGAASATVANPAVTATSHITVTLTGDPGQAPRSAISANSPYWDDDDDPPPGRARRIITLQWVERQPGKGFVVHLTGKVRNITSFTYLIVEP